PHQDAIDHAAGVAFSPDGKTVVTGGLDGTARLWDAATGEPVGAPMRHEGKVWAVTFSPDGSMVLTGGMDGTARLWDATTGRPIAPPLQRGGRVRAVAFSPDGRRIVTGCGDNTARLWDLPAPVEGGRERLTLWAQVLTGMELDADGEARLLDAAAWNERRQRL